MAQDNGKLIKCTIEKTVFGGDGLARVDGQAVFIPYALPGEKIIARVKKSKNDFLVAEIEKIVEPSPHRIQPLCKYYTRCPGCNYGHMGFELENQLKMEQLQEFFKDFDCEFSAYAPGSPYYYRNKVVFHTNKAGRETFFGYVGDDNQTVFDVESCPLARPEINEKIAELRHTNGFFHSIHHGMSVTFRYTSENGALFWRNNPAKNMSWLKEKISSGNFAIPPESFFQVNFECGMELLRMVGEAIKELRVKSFIDLYCGCGFFSTAAAQLRVPQIIGIESDAEAINAARYNMKQFNHPDAAFIAGDAARELPKISEQISQDSLLVVDPPRQGLSAQAAAAIVKSRVRHLIYISCNPSTLRRDANNLKRSGFKLKSARMVNMFPRTGHFEVFTIFERL